MESQFSNQQGKLGSKNQINQELQYSIEKREMTFGSSYWEVGKNDGSRNWGIPLLKNSVNFKSMEALVFYGQ